MKVLESDRLVENEKISEVKWISTDLVRKNPENPRIIFNQTEMDALSKSIGEVGILVPLIVFPYKTPGRYVLLDGERRWICARKLNLPEVPAHIIKPPTRLENILRMFNIHKVREQWQLMPTAWKVETLSDLIEAEKGKKATEKELSVLTGMTRSEVRRCRKLLSFSKKYQQMVVDGRIKTDFLIEMYPIIRTIKNNLPELYQKYTMDGVVSNFLKMYETGGIKDVTDFRNLQKILRAEEKWISAEKKKKIVEKIFKDPNLTINNAYETYVKNLYDAAGIEKKCISLIQDLETLNHLTLSEQKSLIKVLTRLKRSIETKLAAAQRG